MRKKGTTGSSPDGRQQPGHRIDYRWIKEELRRQGKNQRMMAADLSIAPERLSRLIAGQRRMIAGELERIRAYLGMDPRGGGSRDSSASDLVKVVGQAAEGIFVDPMTVRSVRRRDYIMSPETSRWGEQRYSLELSEPIDPSPRVESEWVICVPIKAVSRELEHDDLVHIEIKEGKLKQTIIRRVQVSPRGEVKFVLARRDVGDDENALPGNTKVQGLVVGRNIAMK